MKQGLTLEGLREQLAFENENKRDFIVNTDKCAVTQSFFSDSDLCLTFKDMSGREQYFPLTDWALSQLATHVKVSHYLLNAMRFGTSREQVELCSLLSTRLQEHPTLRMVRTLKGAYTEGQYARAFLSNEYRLLDNWQLFQSLEETLNHESVELESAAITDTNLYLKMVNRDMVQRIGEVLVRGKEKDDIVKAGAVIVNSEIGASRLRSEALIWRQVCSNGLIVSEQVNGHSQVHRGSRKLEEWDTVPEETVNKDGLSVFSNVVSSVTSTLNNSDAWFDRATADIIQAQTRLIKHDPKETVKRAGEKFRLTQDEQRDITRALVKSGDLSQFGLMNAVTITARDNKGNLTYDRASELEAVGGKVLVLSEFEWIQLNPEAPVVEAKQRKPRAKKAQPTPAPAG